MADEREKKRSGGKNIWAGVVSALDPVLRRAAQKLASKVPTDSPLRSEITEMAIGVVKGFTEAISDSLPIPLKIAVEKATDFGDFFSGALGGKTPKTSQTMEDWMQKFFTDAGLRLRKAPNAKTEFEKLKLEFQLRQELLNMIKKTQPKTEESKPIPSTNWAEEWEKFKNSWFFGKAKEIMSETSEIDRKVANHIQEWRNRQTWVRRGR